MRRQPVYAAVGMSLRSHYEGPDHSHDALRNPATCAAALVQLMAELTTMQERATADAQTFARRERDIFFRLRDIVRDGGNTQDAAASLIRNRSISMVIASILSRVTEIIFLVETVYQPAEPATFVSDYLDNLLVDIGQLAELNAEFVQLNDRHSARRLTPAQELAVVQETAARIRAHEDAFIHRDPRAYERSKVRASARAAE